MDTTIITQTAQLSPNDIHTGLGKMKPYHSASDLFVDSSSELEDFSTIPLDPDPILGDVPYASSTSSGNGSSIITSPAPSYIAHLPSKLKNFFRLNGTAHKKDSISSLNGGGTGNNSNGRRLGEMGSTTSLSSTLSNNSEKINYSRNGSTLKSANGKSRTIGPWFLKDGSNNQKLRRVA